MGKLGRHSSIVEKMRCRAAKPGRTRDEVDICGGHYLEMTGMLRRNVRRCLDCF